MKNHPQPEQIETHHSLVNQQYSSSRGAGIEKARESKHQAQGKVSGSGGCSSGDSGRGNMADRDKPKRKRLLAEAAKISSYANAPDALRSFLELITSVQAVEAFKVGNPPLAKQLGIGAA